MEEDSLSLKFAYDFIFTTAPWSDVQSGLLASILHSTQSLVDAARHISTLFLYLLLCFGKLLTVAFPHAIRLGKIIIEYHRTQLSTYDLMIEFACITVVTLLIVFRKLLQKKWTQLEASISAKSKMAAKVAPHVLFFSAAIVFSVVGKKFILPMTSSSAMPLITIIAPLINTVRALHCPVDAKNEKVRADWLGHMSLLWVVLSIYHSFAHMTSFIPFSSRLLRFVPVFREFIIVSLVWAQISPSFTAILFTTFVTPVLHRVSMVIPASYMEETTSQSSSVLSMLKTIRLINDRQSTILQSLLQDGITSIIALMFLLTPDPLASFGMVTVAFLVPGFRTSCTSPVVRNMVGAKKTADSSATALHEQWLQYWLCVGILWTMQLYGALLWPSMMTIAAMWLQHTYFKGAQRIISSFSEKYALLMAPEDKPAPKLESSLENGPASSTESLDTSASVDTDLTAQASKPAATKKGVVAAKSFPSNSELSGIFQSPAPVQKPRRVLKSNVETEALAAPPSQSPEVIKKET